MVSGVGFWNYWLWLPGLLCAFLFGAVVLVAPMVSEKFCHLTRWAFRSIHKALMDTELRFYLMG
jgi:hypothetical protein